MSYRKALDEIKKIIRWWEKADYPCSNIAIRKIQIEVNKFSKAEQALQEPSGEGLIYAPGQFDCPKCRFHLVANNINVRQGTVSATAPADRQQCSNCPDTFMEPTTWKAYAKTLENRFEEAIEIGKRQERSEQGRREGQRQAMSEKEEKPFKRAPGDEDCEDFEQGKVSSRAMCETDGHFVCGYCKWNVSRLAQAGERGGE